MSDSQKSVIKTYRPTLTKKPQVVARPTLTKKPQVVSPAWPYNQYLPWTYNQYLSWLAAMRPSPESDCPLDGSGNPLYGRPERELAFNPLIPSEWECGISNCTWKKLVPTSDAGFEELKSHFYSSHLSIFKSHK